MITWTKRGLYCPAGNFYIDPSGAVENAVITHAHSDHARRGSQNYYCALSGVSLLKARLGQKITTSGIPFGINFRMRNVQLSFHPAGHILGSAQVRLEYEGQVWLVSGDYKREPDPTCEPFEVVPCDVFITEATFGTPSYIWAREEDLGRAIFEWWTQNSSRGINSVLFAYSLGKTQRILGVLYPHAKKPIYVHPAATPLNNCYRAQGIKLAETICLSEISNPHVFKGELLVVPQAFLKSPQALILGDKFETAFASGWMATQNPVYGHTYDRGFVMSDHADWNDLLLTIKQTQAKRVYVQHRGHGALVKHLRGLGIKAHPDSVLEVAQPDQLALF